MSGQTQTYQKDDMVPFHFEPSIIVASVIPALLGSFTAVELLHRKGGQKGWMNWLYQFGIAVSLGLVAIWCMHFIGNRAIILGDGRAEIQLYYNGGFTTISAFLPIIFLLLGFRLVEIRRPDQKGFWPLLAIVGTIAGLAITGMHYVGNFGVSNYTLMFPVGYVLGAAAIAIIASITALTLFFYFKEQWVTNVWKRLLCACVLAGAVSGMHWLASVGTSYKLRYEVVGRKYDRNINLIVAMVCAFLASAVCLVFAFMTHKRRKQLADRAQHVVLASATFDPEGRLLVTQEGLPPCRKVTKQFNQKSFDDEFNVSHPVFQWLYRVTFNWSAVSDLIPGMKNHLRAVGFLKDRSRHSRPSTGNTMSTYEENDMENDYSVIFREYFCVAAEELANIMDVPLQNIGHLYNGILTTGSVSNEFGKKRQVKDLEAGINYPTMFGKGQLLFLVRSVDKLEATKLVAGGYRFAQPSNVSSIIARAMKVSHADIVDVVERLRLYSHPRQPLAPSGTYLACFAIKAPVKAANRDWDILVPTDRPQDLPTVELSSGPLKPMQISRLNKLDGLSVAQSIAYLNNIVSEIHNEDEKAFAEHLLDQVTELTRQVPEEFFKAAVFSSAPVSAPSLGEDRDTSPPQLYAFSIIPDVHGASVKSTSVTYLPLSFFQCIQRVYKHSPDHAILAQRIHREFGAILSHRDIVAYANRHSRANKKDRSDKRLSRLSLPTSKNSSNHASPRDSLTASQRELNQQQSQQRLDSLNGDDTSKSDSLNSRPKSIAYGGIMVSSDTIVEVFEKDGMELEDMGTRANVTVASEAPTYVDELFRITSTRFTQR